MVCGYSPRLPRDRIAIFESKPACVRRASIVKQRARFVAAHAVERLDEPEGAKLNAVSGRPKSSSVAYRKACEPRRGMRSIASSVGGSAIIGSIKRASTSCSRLASMSPSKVAASVESAFKRAFRFPAHLARPRAPGLRSSSPTPRRSQTDRTPPSTSSPNKYGNTCGIPEPCLAGDKPDKALAHAFGA